MRSPGRSFLCSTVLCSWYCLVMRYLGGKSIIAKEIAAIVAPRGLWWEPFCGGLSVSVQLAKYGPGLVSDANPALITLYMSVARGWLPPDAVTTEEYAMARLLPDSDPRKAFIGFGCSFGGKWFGGYAKPDSRSRAARNYARSTARAVKRDVAALSRCTFRFLSFMQIDPREFPSQPECIYADPPYAGTTGYAATGKFDHGLFWAYCQEWATRGVRVFVSEYACPVRADISWEKRRSMNVAGGSGELRTERLFRVQAPSVARCG